MFVTVSRTRTNLPALPMNQNNMVHIIMSLSLLFHQHFLIFHLNENQLVECTYKLKEIKKWDLHSTIADFQFIGTIQEHPIFFSENTTWTVNSKPRKFTTHRPQSHTLSRYQPMLNAFVTSPCPFRTYYSHMSLVLSSVDIPNQKHLIKLVFSLLEVI